MQLSHAVFSLLGKYAISEAARVFIQALFRNHWLV